MSGSGSRRTKKASKSQRAAEKAAARWNKPPPLQPVFAAGDEFMETEETLSPADRLIEGRQRRKRRFEELAKEAAEAKKMPMLEQILENDAVRDGDVQILHNLLDELATVESDEAGFDGELRMSLSDVGESDEPQSSATGRQMDEYLAIRTENAEYRRKLVDLANAYAASNDKLKDVRGKLYDRTRALKRVQGKEVIPQALKPYSSMTEMGRVTAQRRLQSLVSKAFPHNTDDDNKNMLQAAYPDALKQEALAEVPHFDKSEAKSKLRQYTKLSVDLHLNKTLLDSWTQIRTSFDIETANFEDFAEVAISEICVSKHCVERIVGIDLPSRAQYDVEEIPDSIEIAPDSDRWIHTVCAGQMPFAASAAGKDPNFTLDDEGSIENVAKAIAEECITFQRIDHDLRDKLKALEADLRRLYPESDSEFTQLLDRCFEKLGAYRSLYFQQYTGGQYREVLKHIGRLRADLQHPTYGNLAADAAVDNVLRALELLGQVQSFTVSRHLADEEIDQLENTVNELRDHLVQSHPNLKPGHKFHIILKHLVPFARRWKTVNLFSEQAIESAHNVVNRMSTRITSRDKRMKLSLIMRWFKEQNILIDQYGTVSGAE